MNPFTERSRITDPHRFTGRWRELGMIFERLESRRPVMLSGVAGSGKSSLLTHLHQSAASVLEIPDLASFFVDLAVLPDAATACGLVTRALGYRGDAPADLERALAGSGRTVLVCLDGADAALAAGWGEELLERLARMARRSVPLDPDGIAPPGAGLFDLLLVAAAGAAPPPLSEPYAQVRLGAISAEEVRLLTEAYLDESGVEFTGSELRELGALSAGHPAYLQRAAYHLFEARLRPGYGWRAAYLAEARERPVPGAPLPPEVFRGEGDGARDEGAAAPLEPAAEREAPELLAAGRPADLIAAVAPVVLALLALALGAGWPVALAVLVAGYLVAWLATRA
jgi:hypothetical protein